MERLEQLVEEIKSNPNSKGAWNELATLAERQLETLSRRELSNTIQKYFTGKLPKTVEIVMKSEWHNTDSSYEYLSAVLVDGEDDDELKELLDHTFDIQTLSNNPVIEFTQIRITKSHPNLVNMTGVINHEYSNEEGTYVILSTGANIFLPLDTYEIIQ